MNNNVIIKLSNNESYYIVAITPYDGDKYYITNHLSDNATKITDDFVIFKEFIENNKILIEKVEDIELIYEILRIQGFTY